MSSRYHIHTKNAPPPSGGYPAEFLIAEGDTYVKYGHPVFEGRAQRGDLLDQDQLGQIVKSGKLVIYGDVGQTFLYGAKGGEIYVLGSAAGRPLINAVGRPRAVINGTCLDYLAESFMAGDPHNGGGFVIVNGVTYTEAGHLVDLPTPYPGGNLFSLASGGAIFLRDPRRQVEEDQLNGGAFDGLTEADWGLIEPYLLENERLFGIRVEDLLTVDGVPLSPFQVYRKVVVHEQTAILTENTNR